MSRPDEEPVDTTGWTVSDLIADAIATGGLVSYRWPLASAPGHVVVYVVMGERGEEVEALLSRQRLWSNQRELDSN